MTATSPLTNITKAVKETVRRIPTHPLRSNGFGYKVIFVHGSHPLTYRCASFGDLK